jgi:hypothetical protein
MTDEPDERYLRAYHEAGHAVAALIRGVRCGRCGPARQVR